MVMTETRVIFYTQVRCPCCDARLFDTPGEPTLTLTILESGASGTGPVIRCKRCSNDIEVVAT